MFFEDNKPEPMMFGDEDYQIQYEDADDPKRNIMEELVKVLK